MTCGTPRALSFEELPKLACRKCGETLTPSVKYNYAYSCPNGHKTFELASVVPHWSERFEYHGYGLDSDYVDDFKRNRTATIG